MQQLALAVTFLVIVLVVLALYYKKRKSEHLERIAKFHVYLSGLRRRSEQITKLCESFDKVLNARLASDVSDFFRNSLILEKANDEVQAMMIAQPFSNNAVSAVETCRRFAIWLDDAAGHLINDIDRVRYSQDAVAVTETKVIEIEHRRDGKIESVTFYRIPSWVVVSKKDYERGHALESINSMLNRVGQRRYIDRFDSSSDVGGGSTWDSSTFDGGDSSGSSDGGGSWV